MREARQPVRAFFLARYRVFLNKTAEKESAKEKNEEKELARGREEARRRGKGKGVRGGAMVRALRRRW